MISLYNIGFTQKTAEEFFEKLKAKKIFCMLCLKIKIMLV